MVSQDHSVYQVLTLCDHLFLSYAADKQTSSSSRSPDGPLRRPVTPEKIRGCERENLNTSSPWTGETGSACDVDPFPGYQYDSNRHADRQTDRQTDWLESPTYADRQSNNNFTRDYLQCTKLVLVHTLNICWFLIDWLIDWLIDCRLDAKELNNLTEIYRTAGHQGEDFIYE